MDARIPDYELRDRIDRCMYEFLRDTGVEPTHILLDPATFIQLNNAMRSMQYISVDVNTQAIIVRYAMLEVIEVYRPRPFIAVARLSILEGGKK